MKWLLPIVLLFASLQAKQLEVDMGAEGAILINAKTGMILYEKKAHTPKAPASTTKIATALYALECCGDQLEKTFTATRECTASISPQAKRDSNYRSPPHWIETGSTHVAIKNGEELPLYDLLCGMLVHSANDASNIVAHGVGGTIPNFMEEVNLYLKEIGCLHTSFKNPHGLHHPEHLTTPYDLALMAKKGLENPVFREIVAMKRYTCPRTNFEHERTFVQTNLLVRKGSLAYPKAIGVKSGMTQAAGKNLVAAAEENGRCLIAVALGYREDRSGLYRDVTKLFETAFNEPKMRRHLLKKGVCDLTTQVSGARRRLKTMLPDGLFYDYYPAEECAIKASVNWEIPPLPIHAGDLVGMVRVVDERGNVVQETELFAYKDLKPTLWHRVCEQKKALFLGGVVCILVFMWRLRKKRAPRRPFF